MNITIREITSFAEFLTLREVWNQLAERNSFSVPFLTFDWLELWWQAFLQDEPVRILLIEENGVAKAVAPFYFGEQQIGSFRVKGWNGMANSHSNRFDLLIGDKQPAYYEAVCDHLLQGESDWDALAFMLIPAESAAPGMLRSMAHKHHLLLGSWLGINSPYIRLTGDWQSYLDSLSKKTRYVLRKTEKDWQAVPGVDTKFFSAATDVETLIDAIREIENHSWKAQNQMHLLKNDQVWNFYASLIRRAAKLGWLQTCLLSVAGTPVAYELALRFKDTLFSLKISFDEKYGDLKPGMVVQIKMIQHALQLGLVEKDLLGDLDPWKSHLTNLFRPHHYHFILRRKPYPALVWGTEFLLRPLAGKIKRRWLQLYRKESHEE